VPHFARRQTVPWQQLLLPVALLAMYYWMQKFSMGTLMN
jgi:hypothetical protein